MKKFLTALSVILIPICSFMNLPNMVDGQMPLMGIVGSAVFIAFWVLFNILFKADKKLMTYSIVLWSVMSVSSLLWLLMQLSFILEPLFGVLQLVALFGTAPYMSLPLSIISFNSYNTPVYLTYIGTAVMIIIPLGFIVWSVINKHLFCKEETEEKS